MRNIAIGRVGNVPANDQQIENLVDRIWPQLSPQAFLQELLGSRDRLLSAATGASGFSAEEVQLLYRQAAERIADERWSAPDVPLLDYVSFQMAGPPDTTYRHIVVDEVQDLSPMELAMIARRSIDGSMTVLGDLAQSTGAWARDSWDQVIEYLQTEFPANVVELEYGYRVPQQVFDYAAQLLPVAAPGLTPPKVMRPGPADPELIQDESENIGDGVVAATQRYVSKGLNVGVICPATYWDNVADAFRRHGVEWADARTEGIGGPISVLPPLESKGLEFDAIVVVEPVDIVKEAPRGERLLYVALTRTTRYLSVVHTEIDMPLAQPAPTAAGAPPSPPTPPAPTKTDGLPDRNELLVTTFADSVVDEIRSALHPSLWNAVVRKIEETLGGGTNEPPQDPESE
jgi:DNA helicase IV